MILFFGLNSKGLVLIKIKKKCLITSKLGHVQFWDNIYVSLINQPFSLLFVI